MKITALLIALLLSGLSLPSMAQEGCNIQLNAGDTLEFDQSQILIPANCKTFTVKLTHTGRLPKKATGHNWVLTTQSDLERVARDGYRAGEENGWLKPDDPRVIAQTPIIGRGESTEVTIDVSKLNPALTYGFMCSVGGHSPRMRGTLRIDSKPSS